EEYGGLNYYAETVSEDFFRQWGYNVEQFKRLYPCRIYIYDPQTNDRVSSSPGGWHDESGIYLSPYIYLHRIDDEDIRGTLAPWQDYNANGWI
ncbi:MAG: hypothetical protein HUJ95_03585, partial [Bacteroidales bacterium]|nr:hypothetical protein [Bacteroidales bacterium]